MMQKCGELGGRTLPPLPPHNSLRLPLLLYCKVWLVCTCMYYTILYCSTACIYMNLYNHTDHSTEVSLLPRPFPSQVLIIVTSQQSGEVKAIHVIFKFWRHRIPFSSSELVSCALQFWHIHNVHACFCTLIQLCSFFYVYAHFSLEK